MSRRLRQLLSEALPSDVLGSIYNSYDIVGEIAIFRLNTESKKHVLTIAEAILAVQKNVKTVFAQISPVQGGYRLRKLEYVAGENKSVTVHKESGCRFRVDVKECFFSPRLSYERMRLAKSVNNGEVVVNMFAGVGCFSLIVANHSRAKTIFSIDINPIAVKYMRDNIKANRVCGRVVPILGDAKEVVKERLVNTADRVLMPLPKKALDYLPYAHAVLRENRGWIHYYDFEHAKKNENPIEKVKHKVATKLANLHADYQIPYGRVVRTTGPNWYQVVLDIQTKL